MEMEFRIEKRTGALLIGLALLAPATFAQQEFRYEAWHGHSRPPHIKKAGNMGALAIAESGISFAETYKDGKKRKHPHAWRMCCRLRAAIITRKSATFTRLWRAARICSPRMSWWVPDRAKCCMRPWTLSPRRTGP